VDAFFAEYPIVQGRQNAQPDHGLGDGLAVGLGEEIMDAIVPNRVAETESSRVQLRMPGRIAFGIACPSAEFAVMDQGLPELLGISIFACHAISQAEGRAHGDDLVARPAVIAVLSRAALGIFF